MVKCSEGSTATRQSLLERLKNLEDHQSWQQFFDRYWKLIYSMAIKAGLTDAEAQDVVQETAVSVAKKIGEFKTEPARGRFKGWLRLITQRRIADQFRRRPPEFRNVKSQGTDRNRTPTAERIPDPVTLNWEEAWNEEWRQNLVDVAMEQVKQQASSKEWLLFYQQVIKEWPAAKVAEKYHASRASVYMAKYRISKLIKKEVRKLEKLEAAG